MELCTEKENKDSLSSSSGPREYFGRHPIKLGVYRVRDPSQRADKQAITVRRKATDCDSLGSEEEEVNIIDSTVQVLVYKIYKKYTPNIGSKMDGN